MKLPTTKQELLDKVRTSHRKLEVVTATVPADHYRHIAMIWQEQRRHTSAAMILVDVILWNTMILQLAHVHTPGPSASFFSADTMIKRAEGLSGMFQRRFANRDLCELETMLAEGQNRVLDIVAHHSDVRCRIPYDHMVACETGAGGSGTNLSWPASAYCS
ncbi:ClbS/DfsB family four-helix bundle protein [Pseudomonas ceruminis]|uniref:ClbS/DfsB family four-helix bundle protein n=1 Tax=Pseudomonas ceruminis TaxID=2740516 RepID=UPI0015965D00|nr:ClbS/DfsB family four-helix bundle protein [Pseudomonas ceruminis]